MQIRWNTPKTTVLQFTGVRILGVPVFYTVCSSWVGRWSQFSPDVLIFRSVLTGLVWLEKLDFNETLSNFVSSSLEILLPKNDLTCISIVSFTPSADQFLVPWKSSSEYLEAFTGSSPFSLESPACVEGKSKRNYSYFWTTNIQSIYISVEHVNALLSR